MYFLLIVGSLVLFFLTENTFLHFSCVSAPPDRPRACQRAARPPATDPARPASRLLLLLQAHRAPRLLVPPQLRGWCLARALAANDGRRRHGLGLPLGGALAEFCAEAGGALCCSKIPPCPLI
jgi:hypothetical protein